MTSSPAEKLKSLPPIPPESIKKMIEFMKLYGRNPNAGNSSAGNEGMEAAAIVLQTGASPSLELQPIDNAKQDVDQDVDREKSIELDQAIAELQKIVTATMEFVVAKNQLQHLLAAENQFNPSTENSASRKMALISLRSRAALIPPSRGSNYLDILKTLQQELENWSAGEPFSQKIFKLEIIRESALGVKTLLDYIHTDGALAEFIALTEKAFDNCQVFNSLQSICRINR